MVQTSNFGLPARFARGEASETCHAVRPFSEVDHYRFGIISFGNAKGGHDFAIAK